LVNNSSQKKMKNENPSQISLASFFIYNTEFGQKEGKVSFDLGSRLVIFVRK